jgi:List-Bact-rpt repeat protein
VNAAAVKFFDGAGGDERLRSRGDFAMTKTIRTFVMIAAAVALGVAAFGVRPASSQPRFTLTVNNRGGDGVGNVKSQLGGIDCGATCSASYVVGQTVILHPEDVTGLFKGWVSSPDCRVVGPTCTVVMTKNINVTAQFVKPLVQVTKSGSGASVGRVTADHRIIDCGQKCQASVEIGERVKLIAEWSSTVTGFFHVPNGTDECGGGRTCAFTVTREMAQRQNPMAYDVKFELTGIDVNVISSAGGKVTATPPVLRCSGNNCAANVAVNTVIDLKAEPGPGEVFDSWQIFGDARCDTTKPSCGVQVPQGRITLNAVFRSR